MQREHPARPSLAACSPTSRTLRAGCAGGLRPSLTPAAHAAWTTSRRDGKTTFQPNQKTTLEESVSRTTYALRPADIFTRYRQLAAAQLRTRASHIYPGINRPEDAACRDRWMDIGLSI